MPVYTPLQALDRAYALAEKMKLNVSRGNVLEHTVDRNTGIVLSVNGIRVPTRLFTQQELVDLGARGYVFPGDPNEAPVFQGTGPSREVKPTTRPDPVAKETEEKYANPANIQGSVPPDTERRLNKVVVTASRISATPTAPTPAVASFQNDDRRARLVVPPQYVASVTYTAGPRKNNTGIGLLEQNQGILFPYTPTIEVSHAANYSSNPVTHSNFNQYFYKNSEIKPISLSAIFTVQNAYEAEILIAVQHLCRVLTKMPFGNDQTPFKSGSPPPVCRLYAHGDFQLDNVPVVVSSYKMSLPNDVNYFTTEPSSIYGSTSVPMKATIALELIPMYSRREQLAATVTGWLLGDDRVRGYL